MSTGPKTTFFYDFKMGKMLKINGENDDWVSEAH